MEEEEEEEEERSGGEWKRENFAFCLRETELEEEEGKGRSSCTQRGKKNVPFVPVITIQVSYEFGMKMHFLLLYTVGEFYPCFLECGESIFELRQSSPYFSFLPPPYLLIPTKPFLEVTLSRGGFYERPNKVAKGRGRERGGGGCEGRFKLH